jgi:hypothetical protein
MVSQRVKRDANFFIKPIDKVFCRFEKLQNQAACRTVGLETFFLKDSLSKNASHIQDLQWFPFPLL